VGSERNIPLYDGLESDFSALGRRREDLRRIIQIVLMESIRGSNLVLIQIKKIKNKGF